MKYLILLFLVVGCTDHYANAPMLIDTMTEGQKAVVNDMSPMDREYFKSCGSTKLLTRDIGFKYCLEQTMQYKINKRSVLQLDTK